MQTFQQTFATAKTWELNISGTYFTTLECSLSVNVRFFKGGKMLDLGEIKGLLAGLEVTLGEIGQQPAFDRVQIDVQAGDTVKIGIGNGQARYNRGQASVNVLVNTQPLSALFDNQAQTVTNASAVLLAADPARQYLLVQNKDGGGSIFLSFGKAATTANGVRVIPGGAFELVGTQSTQAIHAIGDIASNANVTTVEG